MEASQVIRQARKVGLRYTTDDRPGISRVSYHGGFRYLSARGKPIHSARTLARIRSLVIPPAWTDVWICPQPNGHLQASGRDARGRKQYRYHPRWREIRDATKFYRMLEFGAALPRIRRRVQRDLRRQHNDQVRVAALVVRLLETTGIRVGNEEYARQNHSFGLTTLRDRHVEIRGAEIQFHFRGKSGKEHHVAVNDRRLARLVKRCQDLPGQELFQYVDDQGRRRTVGSAEVNAYLRECSGQDFTAKDFRTWIGSVLAAQGLLREGQANSKTQGKQILVKVVREVASELGNTAAVCRNCYIHPAILEAYAAGTLVGACAASGEADKVQRGLLAAEATLLHALSRLIPRTREA
jgi:DNA topoisomerase-1